KGTGDKGIALKLCKNIEIRNLNIREGGHYAILATGCEGMLIDNVTIKTSRDGLNLSQCSNVEVANCHIDAVRYEDGYPAGGDDAIKLGSDLSLGKARPCKNITFRNCFDHRVVQKHPFREHQDPACRQSRYKYHFQRR
ncbi:MAG: right-handed parallel beta-helix repeat-containing protein, partial [Planctomycetota bacterium]